MTTSRLATLLGIVAAGVLSIFLLPRSAAQPTGLRLANGNPALPWEVAGWIGEDLEIAKIEIDTLGLGTQFARKEYMDARRNRATATIVLSGRDISNSLHRPERCLLAQGWRELDSQELQITTKDKTTFPVRRLHNTKSVQDKDGKTVGETEIYTYYWFVGEKALTAGHFERFFIDNRDRLFRGVDQRWAYVTVSAVIPRGRNPKEHSESRRATDDKLREFIGVLAPQIHGPTVTY